MGTIQEMIVGMQTIQVQVGNYRDQNTQNMTLEEINLEFIVQTVSQIAKI